MKKTFNPNHLLISNPKITENILKTLSAGVFANEKVIMDNNNKIRLALAPDNENYSLSEEEVVQLVLENQELKERNAEVSKFILNSKVKI